MLRFPRVCSFESRRQSEMAQLIERHNGTPTVVASMREIPLDDNTAALEFGERLLGGQIDFVLFLTGVGAAGLLEVLQSRYSREALRAAFNQCRVMVRGPKPVPILKEFGIHIDLRAPEPNTWREVLAELDRTGEPLVGQRLVLQEYGAPSPELTAALRERGASVESVTVYRWDLPTDRAPLEAAIRSTINGEFDILLWTSAQQVLNVLSVAAELGLAAEWRAAAERCLIGSIGPTASERLRECQLPVHLEPSHPKMGHLVKEALTAWTAQQARA